MRKINKAENFFLIAGCRIMCDEDYMKNRLLFDGDGVGDDRRLNQLYKQICKFAKTSGNNTSHPASFRLTEFVSVGIARASLSNTKFYTGLMTSKTQFSLHSPAMSILC